MTEFRQAPAWNRQGEATSFSRERLGRGHNMDRRDRQLLNRQMSHFQHNPRRDGALILALAGVFIAGLTAGGCCSRLETIHRREWPSAKVR